MYQRMVVKENILRTDIDAHAGTPMRAGLSEPVIILSSGFRLRGSGFPKDQKLERKHAFTRSTS